MYSFSLVGCKKNTSAKLEAVNITNDLVLLQSAKRQDDGSILLVPAENGKAGIAAYLPALMPDFKVTFDFKIGKGDGADGIVFAFYAATNKIETAGGTLAFNGSEGYGVEFDTYSNPWDPGYQHIAFIHDSVENHLVIGQSSNLRDDKWHKAEIEVIGNHLAVKFDDSMFLEIDEQFVKNNPYMYISATTGGNNDEHYIRNLVITGTVDKTKKEVELTK